MYNSPAVITPASVVSKTKTPSGVIVEPFGTVTFILKGAANLYLSTETAYSFSNLVQLTRSPKQSKTSAFAYLRSLNFAFSFKSAYKEHIKIIIALAKILLSSPECSWSGTYLSNFSLTISSI